MRPETILIITNNDGDVIGAVPVGVDGEATVDAIKAVSPDLHCESCTLLSLADFTETASRD